MKINRIIEYPKWLKIKETWNKVKVWNDGRQGSGRREGGGRGI